MKTLHYRFATKNEYSAPIHSQQLVLRCTARADEGQRILQETLTLDPAVPLHPQKDGFGNTQYSVSLLPPHDFLNYTSEGLIKVNAAAPAPPPHPIFRQAGTLSKPGPGLLALFETLGLSKNSGSAAKTAKLLCEVIRQKMCYTPGATHMGTTAEQALALGAGVCQDYTHLFLALARLAGLTVRYCTGLTVGEGATHAWPELYDDGAWRGWDPTRGVKCDDSYLRLSVGRDAADCPVERGVFFGACDQRQTVSMEVTEL